MSHLFGKKEYIDDLRGDITQIQEELINIISRTGPQKFMSWKYPDKTGCDVDIDYLLDIYDYNSSSSEDSQLAHFILLELIIDRLIVLMNFLVHFIGCHNLVVVKSSTLAPNVHTICEGMIAAKHQHTDTKNQLHKATQQLCELRSTNARMSSRQCVEPATTQMNTQPYTKSVGAHCISRDDCNKASQTYETAFVACEACSRCQRCLETVATEIRRLCRDEGIADTVTPHVQALASSASKVLSSNEVERWSRAQCADVRAIAQHQRSLANQLQPLRQQVDQCTADNAALNAKLLENRKSLKLERETQSVQIRQFTNKIKQAENLKEEKEFKIKSLEKDIQTYMETINMKDLEISKVKIESEKIEKSCNAINEKMIVNDLKHKSEIDRINGDYLNKYDYQHKEDALKSSAIRKSFERKIESLNEKNETFIARLEAKELRENNVEEKNRKLEDVLVKLKRELEDANAKLDINKEDKREMTALVKINSDMNLEIKKLKNNLEDSKTSLEEVEKKCNLLVNYPDLNYEAPEKPSSLSIAEEMKSQLKSNLIRIDNLQKDNAKLSNSIEKLSRITSADHHDLGRRTQLWKQDGHVISATTDHVVRGHAGDYNSDRILAPPNHEARYAKEAGYLGGGGGGGGDGGGAMIFSDDSPEKYMTSAGDCSFEELRFSEDDDIPGDIVYDHNAVGEERGAECYGGHGEPLANDDVKHVRANGDGQRAGVRHAWMTPTRKNTPREEKPSRAPHSRRTMTATSTRPTTATSSIHPTLNPGIKSTAVTSDYADPSAAMGLGVRKSFIIGRGRTSRNNTRSRCNDRPKFK